jgi:predicted nucleic acid-binding Zn ribbon protein
MSRRKASEQIGDVVARLMVRRGYGRELSSAIEEEVWRQAVGEVLAQHSRPGQTRRGVLQITVRNSTVLQELIFQKSELLQTLAERLPDAGIRDLRFRVGVVDA